MTGKELLAEYWRIYEAYMGRKERLIEVTTTLYVGGVAALLLQDWSRFWLVHVRAVTVLAVFGFCLTVWFLYEQFQMWQEAARFCNAAQSLLAKWIATPWGPRNLTPTPLPGSGVLAPADLVAEITNPTPRVVVSPPRRRISFFGGVFGFIALATVALFIQSIWAWCHLPFDPRGSVVSRMARTIDVSAVVVMLVAGIYLYLASLPISDALTFVGGGKTNEEIKRAERRKKWQSRLGLTLLIVGSFVQVLRLVGVLG